MNYALIIAYLLFFLFLINRIKRNTISPFGKFTFEFIFLTKVACGFFIYWLYTYYYPVRSDADIYKYFDDGRLLHELSRQDFGSYLNVLFSSELPEYLKASFSNWYRPGNSTNIVNTNLVMIKIHSLLFYISGGIYHIHSLFFCFLSFLGVFKLYKTLKQHFNLDSKILIGCFVVPSFILWSSAPLKEALSTFTLFYLLSAVIEFNEKKSIKTLSTIILFIALTFYSKPYFLIGIVFLIPLYLFKSKSQLVRYVFFTLFSFFILWISNTIFSE